MESSVLNNQWTQLRGHVRKFFQMQEDDLTNIDNGSDKAVTLTDLLQNRYGFTRDEARDQLDTFIHKFGVEKTSNV